MTDLDPIRAPHWRVAGVCALLYVVCIVMTVVISGQPTVYERQEGTEHSFVEGGLTRVMFGGYVVLLGYLSLLPAMVFLSDSSGGSGIRL